MPVMELSFFSECLAKYTQVTVLLPLDVNESSKPISKFKTLWLLHGMTCNNVTMHNSLGLDPLSDKYKLAIVMPNADLSFYVNMKYGGDYFDFITDELPQYLQSFLPLSPAKKDNFIAGVSMGAYGAFNLAMNNLHKYAAAVSFSGPMDIEDIAKVLCNDELVANKPLLVSDPEKFDILAEKFSSQNEIPLELIKTLIKQCNIRENRTFKAMFGENPQIDGSNYDIFNLAKKLSMSGGHLQLLALCGTEDFHYPSNLRFKKYAQELSLDYTFIDGPGHHSWEFWNPRFEDSIKWLLNIK
ncbi:MAG TPA: alpha/beta hydrolase family protein [Ruminiclostridium sp.]